MKCNAISDLVASAGVVADVARKNLGIVIAILAVCRIMPARNGTETKTRLFMTFS